MYKRLSRITTEVIDRERPVSVFYEKKSIPAFAGDTVAGALLTAGINVFGRSFKYHRPRGPHCLSGRCARCEMIVDGKPHTRTCQTTVREGMIVEAQSPTTPGFRSMADKIPRGLPTGFYHKAFYKPKWIWPYIARQLRRAPGNLAHVPQNFEPSRIDRINLHPELLVVGGGLAGIEAALTSAREGVSVVLVETESHLGGFELFQGGTRKTGAEELGRKLSEFPNALVLTSTTAAALYPDGSVLCLQRPQPPEFTEERAYHIDPRTMVLTTGTMSRPLMFVHNDRPGILLPEAAQKLVHLYGLSPGKRVFLAGGEDYIGQVALQMAQLGVQVVGYADYRRQGAATTIVESCAQNQIPYYRYHIPLKVNGDSGVREVALVNIETGTRFREKADCLIVSGGRTPNNKLLSLTGTRMVFDPLLNMHFPAQLPAGSYAAGRVTGLEDSDAIRLQGRLSAMSALEDLRLDTRRKIAMLEQQLLSRPQRQHVIEQPLIQHQPAKTFVCFCMDSTQKDIEASLAEGFDNAESAKRYSGATMGSCQGGMCQENYFKSLAAQKPTALAERPFTTPRQAVVPINLGSFAAGHHDFIRRSPLHDVQQANGARMKKFGSWLRPEHFGNVEEEIMAVHNSCGLLDISTLGKFRICGPDAEKLYNRVNTRDIGKLSKGRIFYTATCNQEGVMIDDGIVVEIDTYDYYFTTSTARAGVTPQWYARWCREENWQVWLADLSDHFAGLNIAGPKSRGVLSQTTEDDISEAGLPFMHWKAANLMGVEVRLFRLGFLSDLSYEIHCPASLAPFLWRQMLKIGGAMGLRPIGVEAQLTCRLEKGHVLPGMDLDGNTTLLDAGFEWLWDQSKKETVGGSMLKLLKKKPREKQVIGFSVSGRSGLKEGYLVSGDQDPIGHITSLHYSPILKQTIGLALIKPDPQIKPRAQIKIIGDGNEYLVTCRKTPFLTKSEKG